MLCVPVAAVAKGGMSNGACQAADGNDKENQCPIFFTIRHEDVMIWDSGCRRGRHPRPCHLFPRVDFGHAPMGLAIVPVDRGQVLLLAVPIVVEELNLLFIVILIIVLEQTALLPRKKLEGKIKG